MSVLIAGGDADPNLRSLQTHLDRRGVRYERLVVGAHSHPRLRWNLADDVLSVDGAAIRPSAIFVRYDVFTALADGSAESNARAQTWFGTLSGWAYAHHDVRLLNRASALHVTNKLHVLMLAREVGLDVPQTVVT